MLGHLFVDDHHVRRTVHVAIGEIAAAQAMGYSWLRGSRTSPKHFAVIPRTLLAASCSLRRGSHLSLWNFHRAGWNRWRSAAVTPGIAAERGRASGPSAHAQILIFRVNRLRRVGRRGQYTVRLMSQGSHATLAENCAAAIPAPTSSTKARPISTVTSVSAAAHAAPARRPVPGAAILAHHFVELRLERLHRWDSIQSPCQADGRGEEEHKRDDHRKSMWISPARGNSCSPRAWRVARVISCA